MSQYIELEKVLIQILNKDDKAEIKSTENVISFSDPSWLEHSTKDQFKVDLKKTVDTSDKPKCWYNWLTDYTLKEYFRKVDDKVNISEIDLTGNDFITDQGIIWMIDNLKTKKNLKRIILRSCSQLTEVSLNFLLNNVPIDVLIDMSFTNVQYISPECKKYCDVNLSNCLLEYTSFNGQLKPLAPHSVIIWPSKSADFNGLNLFGDAKVSSNSSTYFDHLLDVRLGDNIPLFNIFNYKFTEVPVHIFVPKNPGQILILLSDNKEEAYNHLIESLIYFLSSSFSTISPPKFIFPSESSLSLSDDRIENKRPIQKFKKVPKKPMIQSKAMSKKMSRPEYDLENEEEEEIPPNPLLEHSNFGYKNVAIQGKKIKLLRDTGYWVSKIPIDKYHTVFGIKSSDSTKLSNIAFGFTVFNKDIWESFSPEKDALLMYNISEQFIQYTKGNTKDTYQMKSIASCLSASIKCDFKQSIRQAPENEKNLFVSVEVDDKLYWSFVFKLNNTNNIVPFLIINQQNCSIELSEDWNITKVSDIKERLKLEKCELENSLNFVTICCGEKCQEVYNEIDEFDWSERLSAPISKLETFISTITEKEPNLIDLNDCSKLSEATRQLEQIKKFISGYKKRFKLFKIGKDDKKALEEILSHVGKNVLHDAELFPHKFSPNNLEHKCQCIMNLAQSYVTIDQVISLNIIEDPDTASAVFQKMFIEARGIYIKKFGLLILNIFWFDSFLKEIITNIPYESNYRLFGVHSGAKVWSMSSLVNAFNNFKVEATDIIIWKEFFIYLGILIPLPCIRHCSSDELLLFVNPMTEGTGKKSHLNSLMKTSETYPEKLEAKVKYEKICQDIYSFYPQLLAKIVSIGQVQLMSPVATVLHIPGGVELLIESGEDHITLSAYLPSPLIGNSSQKFSLMEYLWSTLYLCIDAFDELLINQNILTLQTFSTSRDMLKNYSICYNHNWYSDGLYNNICSLCGNCSSLEGMNCPYNRINSDRRGICLCLRHSRTCVDCGICPSCAQLHWTNHCQSDPCRLMFFDSNGIIIPKTSINPHLSTTFSINIFQDGSDVFFGMGSNKSDLKIDVFGFTNRKSPKTATATDNTLIDPSNVKVSNLSFTISDISMYKPNSYNFSNSSGINVIQELGILTYDSETAVGIAVGRLPVSKERNRFAIEILNPGQHGRITIGLVNDNYPPGQPGWHPVSFAYHGDDGGIYLSNGAAVKYLENFSETGNKIEVVIEFLSSNEDSSNIKRSITWYKNGREIEKVFINSDTDLYPAIGMHSQGEQVKLLDTLVWQDNELSKNPEEILVESDDDISVSPTNTILMTHDRIWFTTINIVPRKKKIKNLNFQIMYRNQGPGTINWDMKSLNGLSSKSEKQNNWTFDNISETKEMFLSFRPIASSYDDFSKWSLRLTLSTVDGIEKHVKWYFTEDLSNMNRNGQSDPYVFEVPDQFDVPTYPSFLLTTISNSSNSEVASWSKAEKVFEKKYFHIPRAEYHLIFKANRRDAWIKCSSFIKPTYTKSFQIGNMISFDSKPSMVVNVDKKDNQLSIVGVSEKISISDKKLQPFTKSGKQLLSMKLSKDEKFKNVVLIHKALLTAPPPSRPWILLFQETQNIRFSDLYFANSCNVYHGINICLLNFLCSSQEELYEWETPCDVITLPFNQKDKDLSHFLFEHSFMDLIDWKNFLFYPFCKGKSPLYDSRFHLVDVQGIEHFDPQITATDAYRTLFFNPSLLECHRLLLNHKISLPKSDKLFPKATHKFSEAQIEFLITCILEKVTGFMLLNNLLCGKKDEYKEVINIDLNSIFEGDNDRSLIKVNATEVCCRIHTPNFTEIDLDDVNNVQEIFVDNNNSNNNIENSKKNNSNLESNPNFIYAKLAQSVIFSGKKTKSIPEDLFRLFKNLKSLELRNMMELENLPSSIYGLKCLQRLIINIIKLSTLPDVWKFPNLRYLEISRCPIVSSNEGTKCNQLQTVKLSSLPLKTYPVFLCDVENLVSLEIQLHGLERLPSEFAKLKSLKELNIYGSPLFYDRVKNEQLKTIQNIEFGYPEINIYDIVSKTSTGLNFLSVGETFVNVPRIGSGYSASADTLNQGGFPSVILQLHQLKSLKIQYQSIRFIPKEIQNLENLESLDLSFNPLLEKIPGEISLIKSMKQLALFHCPSLTVPPQEIISRGSSASLAYLKYLLSKNIICNRTKLMFVGLGEAGKTSLLHALMSQNNCAKEIIEKSDKIVTDGIDIAKWTVEYQNETIQYSTWDFAGQDVYYNTHQFFLSPKAVYIVVWSVRQGIEHGDLDFWLSSIFCHAKDAPVFVVGTRCNQVKADQSSFYSLKQRYPQVVDFKLVDSLTGTGIKELKESLVEVTLRLPYIRQPIPSTILDLENKLIKERSQKDFMTFKEFESTALVEGIFIKDIKNVTQILHDFSSIQYFDTDLLKDFVVINPQWIVDIMSKVVSIVNAKIENGVFYHQNMKDVWNDFDSSLHNWMLSLTEEFDLTYPHPTIEHANIVPCLLSEEEPHIEWPKDSEISDWNFYFINYKFEFLPAGLFNRIQVRLLDFTEPKSVWKLGMYFKKNNHYVLFKREKKNCLTLKAIGVRPTNVLAMIDDIIKGLTKIFFHGIQYNLEISCPDCIENLKNVDNVEQIDWNKIAMISSKVVKKAIDKKIEYLQCPELHLNSMKSIKENTPETASAEEFIDDMLSKIQTAISLYASVDKMITVIHSKMDFNEKSILSLPELDKILNDLNIQSCKITSPRDAAWKASISNCNTCLIMLTDQLAKDKEMNDIFSYIQLLKKKFILVIISIDKAIQQIWQCSPYFNTIFVRFNSTDEKVKKAKQTELTTAIMQSVFGLALEEETSGPYECFFSYCWANSFDAVNKGAKVIAGAVLCPEADPRRLCKFLKDEGIKCWIDESDIKLNAGLNKQLSINLQNSKMMIAFISKEYGESENCMMELNFMVNILKKPVIFVLIGTKYLMSEVGLIIQKKEKAVVLDFSNKLLVSESDLLNTVKETLAKIVHTPISRETEVKLQNRSNAFIEHIELLSRQLLNHLSVLLTDHCPRLVIIDLQESNESFSYQKFSNEQSFLYNNLCLKTICETEGDWHVMDETYYVPIQEANNLIDNCAVYLYLIYKVLEYKNPGLKCLESYDPQSVEFILKIKQIAGQSNVSFQQSYLNLLKFYLSMDPGLIQLSLARYRLASGRDLWMCDMHAKQYPRCRRIEEGSVQRESVIMPVNEFDIMVLEEIKSKAEEEIKKYSESFRTVVESCQIPKTSDFDQNGSIKYSLPPLKRLLRSDTTLGGNKEIVTNQHETYATPIRPSSSQKVHKKEINVNVPKIKENRNRQNLMGSRVCTIQ